MSSASLLVIPNHHRRGWCSAVPDFGEWARGVVDGGNEAVLHGLEHLREPRSTDGPIKRVIAGSYTAGEGEFLDLSRAEAGRRLDDGLEEFRRLGLHAEGFVAPAWLLGAEAEEAVREKGFRYTTRIGCLLDLRDGRKERSRSLVYSCRSSWRRLVSLGWNEQLLCMNRSKRLLRIGLHPPDWKHPHIRRHALRCIERALADRRPITYARWISTTGRA